MPEEFRSNPSPELPEPAPESLAVPHGAAESRTIPKAAEDFGTLPKHAEQFGKIPHRAERKATHTLTVKEVARMFDAAGVARTERSIINWCQPNRQGITRLDCYYDPNERKYYITPQSMEAVIQEEIQRARKSAEPSASEQFGRPVTHVKQLVPDEVTQTDERKIQELEREIMDLKIANRGKDQFIGLMKNERMEFIEKIESNSRLIGQLESKILTAKSLPVSINEGTPKRVGI